MGNRAEEAAGIADDYRQEEDEDAGQGGCNEDIDDKNSENPGHAISHQPSDRGFNCGGDDDRSEKDEKDIRDMIKSQDKYGDQKEPDDSAGRYGKTARERRSIHAGIIS